MMVKIFRQINELLTLESASRKGARRVEECDLSVVPNAAMICVDGRMTWTGAEKDLSPKLLASLGIAKDVAEISLEGRDVLPAFVECHTHLVFAGDRKSEFEMRNQGVSYQEIARQGGGILSTVKATRAASSEELAQLAQDRVDRFVKQGVATVEVKSGYALDKDNELKMLRVARGLQGPRVVTTFLGAHAVPKEFGSPQSYLEYVMDEVLPEVAKHKLADRVDIFVEQGYFSAEQAQRLFEKAKSFGLRLTGHMEQLSRTGGAALAADSIADSADHVVELSAEDVSKLACSETTCVLLPGADFYLKVKYPPARELIEAGARVALATDFNPGSCPTQDLSLIGLLARLEMKMTLPQVISAYTLGAAYALGLGKDAGSLEAGKSADFVAVSGSWRELFYQVGHHPVGDVWRAGCSIYPH